ncbi:site-specific integrase [Nonomuraea sp. CA-218870]|uniref:site-specific integrase n=1 Tax=Nonomuraea sp. CA-218870 TaxID=3239998 RepID=UPI003D8B08DE
MIECPVAALLSCGEAGPSRVAAAASGSLYHLIAFRGLRRGEACGARWVDLDFDDAVLTVARQLTIVDRKVREGRPKTEGSDAPVALDSGTLAVLRAHHRRQRKERLASAGTWLESGRIFTQEDGSELKPDWVSEYFERLVFAAGLPPIRLHDLRHGAATLYLAAGNDMKTTSAMMRHSNQAITSDTYTSVLPELARVAAEASAAQPAGHSGDTGAPCRIRTCDRRIRSLWISVPGGVRSSRVLTFPQVGES